jgi:hypothetical protein
MPGYRRLSIAIAICLLTPVFANASAPPHLSGIVVDEVGAVISNAYVLVRPDTAGTMGMSRKKLELISDRSGRFEGKVDPGFYDVCVMSNVFIPQCRKVRITTARAPEMRFKLKTSREVEREIADSVPKD